jgi:NAD(P)-dependent dehydrogenase (short-subunit alcohol dehydrogenase family)
MNPANTVAVVTGGASGLGAATAARLAEAGATVVIVDLPATSGAQVARELPGGKAAFHPADIQEEGQVQAALDRACTMGALRILVNCAGIGAPAKVVGRDGAAMPLEHFRRIVSVNLIGTFNCIRLAAARMLTNVPQEDGERGVIVNTASIAAFDGQIGQSAYSASKGGIVGMTLPLARDLMSSGIRVCTVAPGIFDTPLMMGAAPNVKEALAESVPFPRRFGQPEEFAALVSHVIDNTYLNGAVIRLDGALRMAPR